jgi:capsular polysaccharide biosynthesis protein
MHPRDLQVLEDFKKRIPGEIAYGKKIYATRRDLKRSPSNEKEIENLFRDQGFEVLQLEKMDLVSEINLMRGVQDLAGVSGSWQFNIIWADKAQTMFDIVNENYWTELAHRVCRMKNVQYNWKIYEGNFKMPVSFGSLQQQLSKIYS